MADFSLALNEDQHQLKDWVHEFAKDVIRPPPRSGTSGRSSRGRSSRRPPRSASTAWTSWPTPCSATPPASRCRSPSRSCSGATPASACRSWARASPPPASPATAPPSRSWSGCRSATAPPTRSSSAPSACPSPTPAPTSRSLRTRAVYDEAKDEWVLNGTKAWITNGGIADVHVVVAAVDPELKGRGQACFIVPPNTPGLSQGQKYKKHGIRASHTAEVVLDDVRVPGSCLLGGKEKLDEKLARAREALTAPPRARRASSRRWPRSRPPAPPSAPRPRHRPRRLRVRPAVRPGAPGVRQADHPEPGDRLHARRHGHRDRRRPPARAPGRLAEPQRQAT